MQSPWLSLECHRAPILYRTSAARALTAFILPNWTMRRVRAPRRVRWARTTPAFLLSECCVGLFVGRSCNRIEASRAGGGVESRDEADDDRESDCAKRQPPGNIRYFCARQILPVKVDRCSPSECLPDEPAERDTEEPAEESHGASFRKEKAAHVSVGRAQRFQDADLAPAFEDGHHQSVDDTE